MLEPVFPFLAGVLGSGGVFLQFVGFQLDSAGVVAGVLVIAGIECFGGFRVFFGQSMALKIAVTAGFVRIEFADTCHFRRCVEALLPFWKLRSSSGDELENLRIADAFER